MGKLQRFATNYNLKDSEAMNLFQFLKLASVFSTFSQECQQTHTQ